MNRIRYLAAGLLCLTGVIHVTRLGIPSSGASLDVVVPIFGVIYLIIGVLLFRDSRTACYFGAVVPLLGVSVGVLGGILGMMGNPNLWLACLLAFNLATAVICFSLIRRKRSA